MCRVDNINNETELEMCGEMGLTTPARRTAVRILPVVRAHCQWIYDTYLLLRSTATFLPHSVQISPSPAVEGR